MNLALDNIFHGKTVRTVGLTLMALAAVFIIAACGDTTPQQPAAPAAQPAAAAQAAPATQGAAAAQPAAPALPAPAAQAAPAAQPSSPAASPIATPTAPAAAPRRAAPSVELGPKLNIVTTTNFVADWVRVIGGDRVNVVSLLAAGADPHNLSPGARDVAMIADADVVMSVGLELEAGWLEELLHNASAEDRIVALGENVDPIEFSETGAHDDHEDEDEHGHGHDEDEDEHGHDEDEDEHDEHEDEDEHDEHEDEDEHDEHEDEDEHDEHEDEDEHDEHEDEDEDEHGHMEGDHHDHAHGALDPHFWFDPIRVKIAVNEIAARLAVLEPQSASTFYANAAAYEYELDRLHAWTIAHVQMVPPERRLLITSHDSLSYFAKLYGFEVVGLVIPSLSTDIEPSAEHIAGLIDTVREHDVPAVFGETTVDEKIVQALARETGAELVQLYSGSLGEEGSGADTYLTMVQTNVERIVEALK